MRYCSLGNIYHKFGVQTIVNAAGPVTRLSGALMSEEVSQAMKEASSYCVDIAELQARAGEIISEMTGAEGGYVSAGAAAGLLLATAACVAGLDPGKMNRLPDTSGMKDEVIISRSHRNFYDHAIRSVGVKLVEVGISDRFSGAGVRDTESWEIADAVTDRTAAIAYVNNTLVRPLLSEVIEIGRTYGIPVIVDAAGQLPPVSNLKRFISEGADLVCFSGGKAIGGPQGTGILCGRQDLISSVALQHLDQDVLFELWNPPSSLIHKDSLPGAPQHGIGRPCKVGKEQIVGLMVALKRFVQEGEGVRKDQWEMTVQSFYEAMRELPHVRTAVVGGPGRPVPLVRLDLEEGVLGKTAVELAQHLISGVPSVHLVTSHVYEGVLFFNPVCIRPGDVEVISRRMKELIEKWGNSKKRVG